MFNKTFGLFKYHFCNLNVAGCLLIKSRRNNFTLDSTFHFGNFLRSFINQKNDKVNFRVISCDGICNFLHQNCFTGFWRSNNQKTLTFTNRCKQIYDTGRNFCRNSFKTQLFVWIKRCKVFKRNTGLCNTRLVKVYAFNSKQGKETLTLFRTSCLTVNCITCF